jgi:glycerol kinase
MEADSGIAIAELRVDGGATVDDMLMQFQADILGVPLVRPKVWETTALGAAYLAGLATGFWQDTDELQTQWQRQRTFQPGMDKARVADLQRRPSSAPRAGSKRMADRIGKTHLVLDIGR